jgi:hypothetical protein
MTRLLQRKTRLEFEAETLIRGRRLCIEATPFLAILREKGTRTRYEVPWDLIYWQGARIAADQRRNERKKRKS